MLRKVVKSIFYSRWPEVHMSTAPNSAKVSDGYYEFVWPNGIMYNGYLHDNKKHGKGWAKFEDGSTYDGQWYEDSMHGQGEYTYADGNWYVGRWERGKRHGKGICIYANGSQYDGEWQSDKPNGFGENRYADGAMYKGFFAEGAFHGTGSLYRPGGVLITGGMWTRGQNLGSSLPIDETLEGTANDVESPVPWPDALQHKILHESYNRERSQPPPSTTNITSNNPAETIRVPATTAAETRELHAVQQSLDTQNDQRLDIIASSNTNHVATFRNSKEEKSETAAAENAVTKDTPINAERRETLCFVLQKSTTETMTALPNAVVTVAGSSYDRDETAPWVYDFSLQKPVAKSWRQSSSPSRERSSQTVIHNSALQKAKSQSPSRERSSPTAVYDFTLQKAVPTNSLLPSRERSSPTLSDNFSVQKAWSGKSLRPSPSPSDLKERSPSAFVYDSNLQKAIPAKSTSLSRERSSPTVVHDFDLQKAATAESPGYSSSPTRGQAPPTMVYDFNLQKAVPAKILSPPTEQLSPTAVYGFNSQKAVPGESRGYSTSTSRERSSPPAVYNFQIAIPTESPGHSPSLSMERLSPTAHAVQSRARAAPPPADRVHNSVNTAIKHDPFQTSSAPNEEMRSFVSGVATPFHKPAMGGGSLVTVRDRIHDAALEPQTTVLNNKTVGIFV